MEDAKSRLTGAFCSHHTIHRSSYRSCHPSEEIKPSTLLRSFSSQKQDEEYQIEQGNESKVTESLSGWQRQK